MSAVGSFDQQAPGEEPRSRAPRLLFWMLGAALVAVAVAWLAWTAHRRAPNANLIRGAPVRAAFARRPDRITDGVIAKEGTPFGSRLASDIENGGSLEWDLGASRSIDRAYLQADNDDAYALVVSNDGITWSTLWEAPPAVGEGLRTRKTDKIHAYARFVRLEPRGGDGKASVSELVLASAAAPWPPSLQVDEDRSIDDPMHPRWTTLLLPAAALALLALVSAIALDRRSARAKNRWQDPLVWTTLAAAAFLCLTALWYAKLHRYEVEDDGYISLQYAKNWATGHGLVFNPGEKVEGYTNFLWVAVLAPFFLVSGRDPGVFTCIAGALATLLAAISLGLVAFVGRRVFRSRLLAPTVAVLVLAVDDSFVGYTTTFALENHLLTALLLSGLALAVARPRRFELWLGLSFALVGMTRPDGLLWPAAFFVASSVSMLRRPAGGEPRWSPGELARIAIVFAVPSAAYMAARWAYFGDPLPNTFYLKVGATLEAMTRGLGYTRAFLEDRLYLPLLALLPLPWARRTWSQWLIFHGAMHVAFVVYVGGDFYAGHRFYLVLLPSLALGIGSLTDGWDTSRFGRRLRPVTALAALAMCLVWRATTMLHGPYTTELYGGANFIDNNVRYMRWLKDVARADSTMVVGDIGGTGLFADVRVIDFFGVVDRAVAHKKVQAFGTGKPGHEKRLSREEALARNPTYIKWGYVNDWSYPAGYYIFNAFPPSLRVEGLWVKDDLASGRTLEETAIHFGTDETSGWSRDGAAFDRMASTAARSQTYVNGQVGEFVDSFTSEQGDGATGHLWSPDFVLSGDRMRLLVGGGRDPLRLYVTLWVDGRRAFSETGTNWETLGRREWDIAPLRGKTAHIEVVDEATGAWGHILVDEVVQWVGTPNESGKL